MASFIDLNLDAGESPEALADGREEALYQQASSVNVACGGHAGDERSMEQAVDLALRYKLTIGAHPSFPDRENFGRQVLQMDKAELQDRLVTQMMTLQEIVSRKGARLVHVKPHGALYNVSMRNAELAHVLIDSVRVVNPRLKLIGFAGSPFLGWCREAGLVPVAEAFVDRRYEPTGYLRPRDQEGALITDPKLCAAQALHQAGRAQTLGLHSDTPGALEIARHVRSALLNAGFEVRSH